MIYDMHCASNFTQYSSARLFAYAFEEEDAEKFERLEALLTKMKQYESFFRAAPEAFLQITYRIVSWDNAKAFDYEGSSSKLLLNLESSKQQKFSKLKMNVLDCFPVS
jgi:hypothetical protein